MKLTIVYEKLKEGVKIAERLAQKSLTLPILQNILLKTDKSFICLESTNLEVGIKYWSLIKKEKDGELLVSARVISQLIDFLPPKPIDLKKEGNDLSVSCENYKSLIRGFNPEEFPIIPEIEKTDSVTIPSSVFCQALNQVVDIASPSVARPEISGIYFAFQKKIIKIVATDSFRLAEQKIILDNSLLQEYSLILPQQTAKEIINIFGQKEGDLKIYFSPNQILFETLMAETNHPQIHLISRLVEGNYPDYETIIPDKTATQIQISKNEFLNQIKLAGLFAGKTNEVSFKVNPQKDKLDIFSQDPDSGDYKSSLNAKIKGKEIDISFNYRFLVDGILKIKSPDVLFELTERDDRTGEGGKAILKPSQEENFLYIAMPMAPFKKS